MSASANDSGRPGRGLPFRNLGLSLISRVVSLASHVVSLMVLVRMFTKEEVAVIAVAGIVTVGMDASKGLGLGTFLLKRLPAIADKTGPEARTLLSTFLFYSLLIPVALTAIGCCLPSSITLPATGAAGSARALQICVLIGLFTVLSNTNLVVLQASQEFGQLAAFTLLSSVLQRLAPCLAAFWMAAKLETFLTWTLAATVIGFAATCAPVAPKLRPLRTIRPLRSRLLSWRSFWPESRHFYASSLLRYASTQVDQLFVAVLFPPATLAVYFVLRRIFSLVIVTITSLIDALIPELAEQAAFDQGAARGRLTELARLSLFAGSAGAAVVAGNGSAVIELLLGPGYGDDRLLIALFAASTSIFFLYCFVQLDVMLFQASRKVLWMAVATATANLLAGPLTRQWFGVYSLPMATLAGYLVGLLGARWKDSVRGAIWRFSELGAGLTVVTLAGLAPLAAQAWRFSEWEQAAVVNLAIAGLVAAHFWRNRVGESLRRLSQGTA